MATINGQTVSFGSLGDVARELKAKAHNGLSVLRLMESRDREILGGEATHLRDISHAATSSEVNGAFYFYFGN